MGWKLRNWRRRSQSPGAGAPQPPPQPPAKPPPPPKPPRQKERPPPLKHQITVEKYVPVESLVNLITKVAYWEIGFATLILLAQTIAIAASYDFASRSLTGIWTSWFFYISAAVTLFWSSRCTFNGLLAVLVLQIIAATMSIPLFTACCVMFGVYPFVWSRDEDGSGRALVGSSIVILVTSLVMMVASVCEMVLNAANAYNCYFLAYVGKPKVEETTPVVVVPAAPGAAYNDDASSFDSGSVSSVSVADDGAPSSVTSGPPTPPPSADARNGRPMNGTQRRQQWQAALAAPPAVGVPYGGDGRKLPGSSYDYDEPSMPRPPPDTTLTSQDIHIIKYCGAAGVIVAMFVFCTQLAMLALAREVGIGIGVGFWAAALFSFTGVVTVVGGWNPNSQRIITVFVLQIVQVVLSVPLAGIAYYTVAVFGSCMQDTPVNVCPTTLRAGLSVTILGGMMAIAATMQGLISLVLVLICSQTVCGIRCMISGATVYPTL